MAPMNVGWFAVGDHLHAGVMTSNIVGAVSRPVGRPAAGGLAADGVVEHRHLLIGGDWRRPHSTSSISVHSANTQQLIGRVPEPDREDLDAAVVAARAAFDDPSGWSQWEPAARAAALCRLADAIDRRAE